MPNVNFSLFICRETESGNFCCSTWVCYQHKCVWKRMSQECSKGGGGGGHRWRICAKHNYKMWCSIIGQISLRLWVDFQFHFLSRFFDWTSTKACRCRTKTCQCDKPCKKKDWLRNLLQCTHSQEWIRSIRAQIRWRIPKRGEWEWNVQFYLQKSGEKDSWLC